jgi:hypothetical protein
MASMTNKPNGQSANDHPSIEDIAAYLSGALTAEGKADLEAHLGNCRDCRREVTSARRLLHSRGSNRGYWIVPGLAAAVLAVVLLTPSEQRHGSETSRVRSTTLDGSSSVQVVTPANRQTMSQLPIRFVWHRTADDALYHVTLTDAAGTGIWTGETSDTTLVLPSAISLRSTRDYLWFVDAVPSNGRSITSGAQLFRITR